jgi:hypothetical protein
VSLKLEKTREFHGKRYSECLDVDGGIILKRISQNRVAEM